MARSAKMEKADKTALLRIFISLRILASYQKSEHKPIKSLEKAVYRVKLGWL
jgi:hypothetical protein